MTSALRRVALRLGLCALAGLSAWGLYSARLFQQEIWLPLGVRRFLLWAALYAGWWTAVALLRPRWFAPATFALVLGYTVLAVGPAAPAAVLLFLFSAYTLGRMLVRASGALEDLVALLAGLSVYVLAVSLAVRFPVNHPVVYLAAMLAPVVARPRHAAACLFRCAGLFRPLKPAGRWDRLALALALFVFLTHWLVVLKPEAGADALGVHLVVADSVAAQHRWHFDFQNLAWAVMPMGANWAYTAVYLLGGEYAARLLNFALLALLAALLGLLLRRWLPPAPALLMVALFGSSPLVQLVTGSLFGENFWAVMLFGALAALFSEVRWPAAMLAGTAVAAKYGALAFAAPLAIFAALFARRLRAALVAVAVFLVFAAPPYLAAYLATGNPVYPFANATFRSPYYDASRSISDPRFQTPLAADALYQVTFHTSRYLESQDGALGFHYLLLAPLSLLLLGRNWPRAGWAALVISLVFFLANFAAQSNVRYLYPILPLWMLLIGLTAAALRVSDPAWYRVVCATACAVAALNLWFLPASNWYHKDFRWLAPRDPAAADRYLETTAPVRKLVSYLNRVHPNSPAVFLETSQIAGLRARAYSNQWHSDAFLRRLRALNSPREMLDLARQLGVRHFIAPAPASGFTITEVAAERFLAEFTEPEYRAGKFHLASVRDRVSEDREPPVAKAGTYDDLSPALSCHGPWLRGRGFRQAFESGVTYTDAAGAEIRLRFEGQEVHYVHTKAPNRGRAEVFLDGASRGVLDLYSPRIVWRAAAAYAGLADGPHTLLIRVLPSKSAASAGSYVDVDALVVR